MADPTGGPDADGRRRAISTRRHAYPGALAHGGDASARPSIAFLGLFGVGNLGNDASLASAIDALRSIRPDAEIACICPAPVIVGTHHAVREIDISAAGAIGRWHPSNRALRLAIRPALELARFVAAFRQLREIDVLVVPGTGFFDDFGVKPQQTPLDTFRWMFAARVRRMPICLLSIGAGPIVNRVSRFLLTRPIRWAGYCSVRDVVSREFLTSVDARHADLAVLPDLVFSMKTPGADRSATRARNVVGLGVMGYYGWRMDTDAGEAVYRSYLDKLATFVGRMLDDGHVVELGFGDLGDQPTVGDLVAAVRSRGLDDADRLLAPRLETLDDVLAWVGRCDVVVASRFHNVIAALMMDRPVVSLGYSTKFDDLMDQMGLGAYIQHVESFHVDQLVTDVDELLDAGEAVTDKIVTRVAEYADALRAQYEVAFASGAGR